MLWQAATRVAYQAIPDDRIIGVLYLNGEERQVIIRKAPGGENIQRRVQPV